MFHAVLKGNCIRHSKQTQNEEPAFYFLIPAIKQFHITCCFMTQVSKQLMNLRVSPGDDFYSHSTERHEEMNVFLMWFIEPTRKGQFQGNAVSV